MRRCTPFLKGLIWLLAIPVFFSCWNDITEVYIRSISVNPTSMTLREGESSFINHTIYPANASIKSVKWSCSDTTVVKVSDGNVQAVGRGTAVVTVVTLDGSGLSADCNVKVIRATDAVVFGEGVDPDHVFGPEGGEFSISFKAEEDWTLDVINTRADNWLSFSPSSGKAGEAEVKVTVPENTGYEERFAELRLCCDKEEYPFTVTQKQKDALTVTSGRYEVEAGGGSVTVTVTANVEFGYTVSDSWIKAVSTKALESHTLEFTISPNEDVNVREGHIVIEGAGLSETVTVYQHGTEPALAISGKEYEIGSEGGVLAVEITSNVDVTVEIPSEIDWLRETASQSTGRVCIEVDANPLPDDRSAQVTIVSPEYGLSETLTILQKKHAELDVDTSGITVPQDGGSFEVTLESNVQYAVSVSDPWIQEVSTKGLSEYSHSFVAEALPKDVFERSAQIVFSTEDGALERSISVFQKDESEIITFADPAVKAICVGEWDRNGDGELSIREAAVITGLGTLFNNNQDITSFDELRFFTGLSGIDDYAFYNCPSLKSVTLPAQISKIGEYAFCGCESLLEVIIPDTVQIISKGAFYQCTSLGSIIIPAGVLQIGTSAFYGCRGLNTIIILAQQPPSLGESVFKDTGHGWIYVPDESVSAYKEDDSWKAVADRIASKAVVDASLSIEFKDALVKEICVQNWDRDKDGELSELEASLVSSFRGVFQNNGEIVSFDELRYFIGLESIDSWAFCYCTSLKSVTLPGQIVAIGEYAFYGCGALETITIPESVSSLGAYAFGWCNGLKCIDFLPLQPPVAGEGVFANSICWIFVPDASVTEYSGDEGWAVYSDRIIDRKTAESSPVISFKDGAVKGICVERWDRSLDEELSELEASRIKSISGCFSGHDEIVYFDELRFFTGLEAIDNWTFSHCTSLQSVTLPPQISLVGEGAFYNCSSLVGIVIPEHVVSLGQYAFYLCSGLKNVDILPETVPDIGERCFDHTNDCWLFVPGTSVAAYRGDERWSVYSDRIIDRKTAESSPVISFKDNEVKALCVSNWDRDNDGELSELEASLVISLGQIFCNNKEIASFDELSYFSGLESINSWDFGYCTSLKSVALPGQLSVIGEYAFSCCESLEMITIPESVSSLGAYAFGWCYGLKSIELLTLRPPVAGEGVFANSICWIFVPDASVTEYSGDEGWAVYSDRIIDRKTVESSPLISFKDGAVKGICVEKWDRSFDGELSELEASRIKSIRGCFSGHEEIVCFDELRFFTGLEAIDNRVFSYCKSLKSIVLPGQISAIGEYAFYDCESLEGIVLPESIASLGANAFGWCRNLKSIDILSGQVPQAGENLFYNSGKCWIFVPCASVTDYRIDERWREYSDRIIDRETAESSPLIIFKDDAVKSICVEHWDRSFDGELSELEASRCRSISGCFSWNEEIISFDELRYFTGIESIDEYSFYGCRSLVAIVVPENVTSIGVNAFAWCDGLKSIELLPRSVPETGSDAFIYTGICWIYVPEGCASDYRENEGWRPYQERIVTRKENDSSPVIQFEDAVAKDMCVQGFDRSFDGELSQLEASSIKSLGYIFQKDNQISSFEEFRFFTGLESLSANSFSGCKSLASIVIPESVKSIGRYAFYWSKALQSIDFLSSEPPEIAENCFAGIGASFFIYVPESSVKAYKESVCWHDYSGRITCRGHQPSEYFYKSVDYSKDKTCVQLQEATVGRGLNLVFMGDGFTDRDLQGGTYEEMARGYMEQIFVYEPFKSFRNRFNVWLVYAISENSEFFNPDSRRAFSSDHEDGSISLAWDATNGYKEAVPNPYNLPLKMSLFFNCDQSLGRSYSGVNINSNTLAVIFEPLEYRPTVINHELGHGFAALADEYEEYEGAYPNPEGLDNDYNIFGWWANVDWRNDPATVRWSHLLADSRYSEEGLGIFEGAKLYPQGIYRPTFNSMMRFDYSKGAVYNAPCREQIYKVIMSLSEGEGWEYDYETFVKDDEAGRKQAADAYSGVAFPSRNAPGRRADKDDFKPGLPPILLNDNVRSVRVYPDGKVRLEY